jgi:hypothetical protein
MLYLTLPDGGSKAKLPATLKERILSLMFDNHVGFLHACEQLGISKPIAMHDYKVDAHFAENVDLAERMLVMYESEKILQIADGATPARTPAGCSPRLCLLPVLLWFCLSC